MIFNSIQEFRAKATEDDKQKLTDYIQHQKNKAKALPNDTYHFSYSSAVEYLRQEGYQIGRVSPQQLQHPSIEHFIIFGSEQEEFISRSIVIKKSISDRFDKLAGEHWQYSKKAIINKLLDEGLKKYGY